ncbi:long-chain-fatty-acid--CoA ligase 6 [Chytridium lagenaria]|nr:long-chain-fatty-acid--CoA ligase 6 [Chytridium lagenaria]
MVLAPTLFPTVPRLLSRLYDKVTQGVESSGFIKKWLFDFAYRSKLAELRAGRVTRNSVWDRLVFSKIQNKLGGNVRMMLTGAAPISPDILDFLRVVMGCQVLEGYGQTESSASGFVTIVGDYRTFPHVGVPFTCCEYKLVDIPSMNYLASDLPNPRGEICIRGHNVMKSYYKAPELTAEALDEGGWLHTGDVGMINPDGTLAIIDRVKAQFKLQQGEYVSPERVEIFTKTKWVLQSFVFGESLRSSCVMIVVPDDAVLLPWAKENNKNGSLVDLCEDESIKQMIFKSIVEEGRRNGLKGFELPSAIHLSAKTFEELGLLTPTFKTKRHEARKVFAQKIEALYIQ